MSIADEIKNTYKDSIVNEIIYLGQYTLEVKKDKLKDILADLKNNHGFAVLMDLTGVDFILPHKRTKVLYWLHNPTTFNRIRIIIYVDREESLPTVSDLWAGAKWYERELYDLFGVLFDDHADLKRILMPDDWVGHPLRKDYALGEEPVEFKHGVKPKVPSEIIPHVPRIKKS